MNDLQVRARTQFAICLPNLSDILTLDDPEAAVAMNARMALFEQVQQIHERSYVERGIIIREFEKRQLWKHLIDPETDQAFPHLTAWLSCRDFLGCRRTNFEAKRDLASLADVPAEKLIDVPKGNLKLLVQLSTQVRNDDAVLQAARTLKTDEFEEKIEAEHPHQHVEARRPLRFNPGRNGAKVVEQVIAWALEHDIAGSRDEALVRMAETALDQWQLDQELKDMPQEVKPWTSA